VRTLYEEIGKILGLDKAQTMVIVGAGRLGQALANYVRFEKRGFRVIGIFDNNPDLVGTTVRQCVIRPTSELADFLDDNHVDIVTLAIPRKDAPDVSRLVTEHGVHAIWNFTPVDLNLYLPEDVVVENVHLSESLMKLSCDLQHLKYEK
jgi:redox-sensing transcriptional repressor